MRPLPCVRLDTPMTTFKGVVRGDDLPALVEFLSSLRQTGVLDMTTADWSARLGFRDARIIAASFDDKRGMQAIGALRAALQEADFVYAESSSPPEQEFELTVEQIREHFQQSTLDGPPVVVCPALGMVDDRRSYTTSPTALHRCFAFRSPAGVTKAEQREVCLAGGYQDCPRFQGAVQAAASGARTVSAASLVPVRRTEVSQLLEPALALPAPQLQALEAAEEFDAFAFESSHRLPLLPVVAICLAAAAILVWVYLLVKFGF
jgi:hypothetical protein